MPNIADLAELYQNTLAPLVEGGVPEMPNELLRFADMFGSALDIQLSGGTVIGGIVLAIAIGYSVIRS